MSDIHRRVESSPGVSGSTDDQRWMKVALAAARRAEGRTGVNPPVGCAIVTSENRLCAVGHTAPGGRPHAEIRAIAKCDASELHGASVFVTLEPCSHDGETGPCASALIAAGVGKVVIATLDPDRRVNGRGAEMLRASGIAVTVGCLEQQARQIMAGFLKRVETGLPFVTVKTATSLDGMIALADGRKRWLTGPQSRRLVHTYRSRVDAILTGVGTVLADDPRLTVRNTGIESDSPHRFVLDSMLRTPQTAALFSDDVPVTLFCLPGADEKRARCLHNLGANIVELPGDNEGRPSILEALRFMAAEGSNHVLVEAGAGVLSTVFAEDVADRVIWTQSNHIVGSDGIPVIGPLKAVELSDRMHYMQMQIIGPDRCIILERHTV